MTSNRFSLTSSRFSARVFTVLIIIIIIIQHLYSAMESEDTEALGGAKLRHVKN